LHDQGIRLVKCLEHVQAREGDGKPWNKRSCKWWFTCIVKWINNPSKKKV